MVRISSNIFLPDCSKEKAKINEKEACIGLTQGFNSRLFLVIFHFQHFTVCSLQENKKMFGDVKSPTFSKKEEDDGSTKLKKKVPEEIVFFQQVVTPEMNKSLLSSVSLFLPQQVFA